MASKNKFGMKVFSVLCASALAVAMVGSLSGCAGLNIITNSDEPTRTVNSTLSAGTTITDGTLTVGINTENSPYGGTNSEGDTMGFDVDVAKAIATKMGCKLQIASVGDQGLSSLQSGEVDVSMSAVKTGKNAQLNWSNPYISDGVSLFCKIEDEPSDPFDVAEAESELKSGKVIVANMTSAYLEVKELVPEKSMVIVDNVKEGLEALESGKAKYLAADAVVGSYLMNGNENLVRINFCCTKDVTPRYAVCLAKNAELSKALNSATEEIASDGTLRVIVEKWFGTDGTTLMPGDASLDLLPKSIKTK